MKFGFTRAAATTVVALVLAAAPAWCQNTAGSAPQQPQAAPQEQPSGKVIFSRSTDDNGQTTTQVGPKAGADGKATSEPSVDDADRIAIVVTALDIDVRLDSLAHQLSARALVTVRNDGKVPLARIPLQISSTLNWEQIRSAGRNLPFTVAVLNSDTDHTGQLHEAAIALAQPLMPGATAQLDVMYSGEVVPAAQRLVTIGTPEAVALHTDWDEISTEFTGLRGFGNVVWYPVTSVPVILGDGARLFDEIGRHKFHNTGSRFAMRLTVEFPHGDAPTVALVNGRPVALTVDDARGLDPGVVGIATAKVENAALGFEEPSLFVAVRKAHAGPNVTAWVTPDNEVAVQFWLDAASTVTPFIERWLGSHANAQLTLLDLPDPEDAPYETGEMLAAPLHEVEADRLNGVLAHALTHAYLAPGAKPTPAWLHEGLATFMESLWVEKKHGRDQALGMLEADRAALAIAEPPSPGTSSGQPLAVATEPIYYRTKAAYVLWMLRDLAGDEALATALHGCASAADGCSLQALLQQAGSKRDLAWFFSDWVDADKGLPDLTIDGVFPNAAQSGTYLVAVNVANSGYAAAEVPVTVRTAKSTVTERLMVPARGRAVQRLLVVGPPTQVQVNDGTVPETTASVHVTDISSGPGTANSSSSSRGVPPH
ncbi:MAG: hypothetical protein WBF42_07235 [Terracidiphilus sp.]